MTTPPTIPAPFSFWSRLARSLFWMVVIAFVIRIVGIFLFHTYKFRPGDEGFAFGWEMGRIGRALVMGRGFSDPFHGQTGPTAWEPPLYPYLVAAAFRLFGVYSRASAFALIGLNCLFSALTCLPVFFIARRSFGERVGRWAAWTWVLLPSTMYWAIKPVWETSLSALLLSVIFLFVLELEQKDGLWLWAMFGILWGAIALSSTSLLSFLPFSGLYAWYRRHRSGRHSLLGVLLASLLFIGCITPWLVRNQRVFGRFIFIRSNFGAELRLGNGPDANGMWMFYLHPTLNVLEMRRYAQMGEIAYVESRQREAMAFIRENPGRFAFLSLKRFDYFWAGVPRPGTGFFLPETQNWPYLALSVFMFWGLGRALRKRKPHAWLFFGLVLFFPAVYYFVFPHARYRAPIEPEMVILAAFVVSAAEPRRKPLSR